MAQLHFHFVLFKRVEKHSLTAALQLLAWGQLVNEEIALILPCRYFLSNETATDSLIWGAGMQFARMDRRRVALTPHDCHHLRLG
jgi:hypothetical protein